MRRIGVALSKTYGEKRIVGHTESGDGLSMKIQCADVKKVLASVHKMNMGGNVVVLDGKRNYMQNKKTDQKTIDYEKGKYVMYVWVPTTETETVEKQNKILKGNKFATESGEPGFSRQVKKP